MSIRAGEGLPATERTGTAPGGQAGLAGPASTPPTAARPDAAPARLDATPENPGTAGQPRRAPNGYATAALTLGAAGFTLITVVPAAVFGILGLRRARRRGAGVLRCWLGIGLAAAWAAAGGFLVPRLVQASDPGCAAYKGPALAAYGKVIGDFSGRSPGILTGDVSRAITALDAAASRSHSHLAARDLSRLAAQLTIVLTDARAGKAVPDSVLSALNRAAADADSACGTVRF